MTKRLIYVVDPMCSWCWGFSPVFEQISQTYEEQIVIDILLGGLRPGNTERFDESRRSYILSHWHAVHERTNQPFNFVFRMGPTFTYDTEPPSRGAVVVRHLAPSLEAKFLRTVQEAFYVHNRDVTKEDELANLAEELGLNREKFLERFQDPAVKETVWNEFEQARQWGVNGFPTLLGHQGSDATTLTHGYQPFSELKPKIDDWLRVPVALP